MKPWHIMTAALLLLSLTGWAPRGEAADEGRARKLINSQGCKACHALEGDGGKVAASFEVIRETRTRSEIRALLVNPNRRHGNTLIPDFSHLSAAEIDALVEFMHPQP